MLQKTWDGDNLNVRRIFTSQALLNPAVYLTATPRLTAAERMNLFLEIKSATRYYSQNYFPILAKPPTIYSSTSVPVRTPKV